MQTPLTANGPSQTFKTVLARAFAACLLFYATSGLAQLPPGTKLSPVFTSLDSWSFNDTTNWTSDLHYAPSSYTNITGPMLGNGASLLLDSTDPTWLRYNVYEADGATNLTVDSGSITLWFAPASWASTNQGGIGPGQWGRLIEVGAYTADASHGWWSLLTDPDGANLYFTVQPGDGSTTTYLMAPIAWTTNYWHFVALTYSATNTALYLDGALATNGPGITAWPSTNVLARGFYIGSDSNGMIQAQGHFDDIHTYSVPLDANAVGNLFNTFFPEYFLNPLNMMANIISAPSTPSYTPTYNAITGPGNLQSIDRVTDCVTSTNFWITNVVVAVTGNGNINLTFTVEGGQDLVPYDVFANSVLGFGTNTTWAWMGQGYQCKTYQLTNLPNISCFLILGSPQDTDGDGLTDAYEMLVSHTNPNNPDTDGDGISDSDEVLNQTDPLTPNPAFPSSLNIQACPQ